MIDYNSETRKHNDDADKTFDKRVIAGACVVVLAAIVGLIWFFFGRGSAPETSRVDRDIVKSQEAVRSEEYAADDDEPVAYYNDVDESLDTADMLVGFESLYPMIDFYGNGKDYLLTVTGSVKNLGDGECDARALPDLTINGVSFEGSFDVETLRIGGRCNYRYAGKLDKVPDSFDVTFGEESGKTKLEELEMPSFDGLSMDEIAAAIGSGDVLEMPFAFDSATSSQEKFVEALLGRLKYLDLGRVDEGSFNYTNKENIYSLVDVEGTRNNKGYHLRGTLRNNQYHETNDIVTIHVYFFDKYGEVITSETVKSDKKLGAGESFDFSVDVGAGSEDIARYSFSDITGL